MATRDELLTSIAAEIADYRLGNVAAMTPEHVDRWIRQFDDAVQVPMLVEFNHVFSKVYCTHDNVMSFLKFLTTAGEIAGDDPAAFWAGCEFLDIQGGGASQTEMLEAFDAALQDQLDLRMDQCAATSDTYVYIDDAIFSGTRARNDLVQWVKDDAPDDCTLHVIVIALHTGGEWHAKSKLKKAIEDAGKTVKVHWWRSKTLENRLRYRDNSDVFWPKELPNDALVAAYAQDLTDAGYPPENSLRTGTRLGSESLFSSTAGRELLEQELLKAGARIREMCPNLSHSLRPLGFSGLKTLGFGSLVVTYRNCPNTCPLAFWVDSPWYPLFSRKTNTQTAWDQAWA